MGIIGQIIGFIVAVCLFRLAHKLYDKEKIATGGFVLVLATLILFCSFTWFQGWAKSVISSNIISELEKIGQQVTTVQDTTSLMLNDFSNQMNNIQKTNSDLHNQLAIHQTQIDNNQNELEGIQARIRDAETNIFSQQSDITNQFRQISMLQSQLSNATTNLDAQAKKLSDVEYWVDNLFDKTTNVSFSIADTNNVLFVHNTNGFIAYFVRLDDVPIKGSVEMTVADASSRYPARLFSTAFLKNMFWGRLYSYDTNTLTFSFHYVIDSRETNFNKQMPQLGKNFDLSPDFSSIYY